MECWCLAKDRADLVLTSFNVARPRAHPIHRPAPPTNRRVTVRAPGFATIRGVVDADLQDLSRLSSSL